MAGFVHTSAHGQLTVDLGTPEVDLMTPAWRCVNLGAVWATVLRGSSLLVPTVAGRKSRARRVDELVVGLEIMVTGQADSAGAAASPDVWSQLADNIVELSTIATPPSTNQGHGLTLTFGNGDSYTASGFFESFQVEPQAGSFSRVAVDLVIPAGVWAPVP